MSRSKITATAVAASVPFDNATNGFAATDAQAAIEEVKTGGNGVTPPFFFSRSGSTLAAGTYFFTGNVSTSSTGQLIAGSNKIIKIAVSTSANITGSPCLVQFQRRTAVATFVDIAGASISIPVGTYSATSTGLALLIGPDWELSCYFKSGGSPSNPVVGIYLIPQ